MSKSGLFWTKVGFLASFEMILKKIVIEIDEKMCFLVKKSGFLATFTFAQKPLCYAVFWTFWSNPTFFTINYNIF